MLYYYVRIAIAKDVIRGINMSVRKLAKIILIEPMIFIGDKEIKFIHWLCEDKA